MKSKTKKKHAVSEKINEFLNENLGFSPAVKQNRLKMQVLFSLPTGSFIKEALDFRISDPEITEITLWKVKNTKTSRF
jgi:hypothetical protein